MKRVLFILFLTVIGLSLIVIFLIRNNGYQQFLPEPVTRLISNQSQTSTHNGSELDFQDPPAKMFKVVGKITKPFYYSNDWLTGSFVIFGDPNQTEISVLLLPSDGEIDLGTISDTGSLEFNLISQAEAEQKIPINQLIELRFVYDFDSSGNTLQQQQLDSLKALIIDTNIEKDEYVLFPHMVALGGFSVL